MCFFLLLEKISRWQRDLLICERCEGLCEHGNDCDVGVNLVRNSCLVKQQGAGPLPFIMRTSIGGDRSECGAAALMCRIWWWWSSSVVSKSVNVDVSVWSRRRTLISKFCHLERCSLVRGESRVGSFVWLCEMRTLDSEFVNLCEMRTWGEVDFGRF